MVTFSPKHYRISLFIRGILALVLGVAALLRPDLIVLFVVTFFGVYALADGIFAVYIGLQERKVLRSWWSFLFEGLIGIVIGIIALTAPLAAAFGLLALVAVWAILTGLFEFATAFAHSTPALKDWVLAIAGIISIIFGILLLIQPRTAALTIVLFIGVYGIIFGCLLLYRAIRLRVPYYAAG